MAVFISYNHEDKSVAEALAKNLVQAKHNVWIDLWELNAGDSLIERIEDALSGADAILVLLSENSIRSEWCKKELKSGLIRELDEKSVLVIPVILDDCDVPLFLREKLCIDFRKDKDEQLAFLLRSIARILNPAQGRADTPEYHIDWSMAYVTFAGRNGVEWVFVDHGEKLPYVVMTQVLMFPVGRTAKKFDALDNNEDRFRFSAEAMNAALREQSDFSILLTGPAPEIRNFSLRSSGDGEQVQIELTVRKMGLDNGMDTLVYVDNNLQKAVDHTLGVTARDA
ncbi:toll/interleukin-1 receptor domain-containing protein [Pseudovibrio ascidiaceicola]|uniref:toll/interleukin-1 receptor domain-containing protein n=1 Tax=Pseudovibrio ascidiaceicola TaxID=285279 RepID=UPI000D685684|nr:toll/interleukin-1 receptor domain-containing protein [Pseudovibrio ascidiaceicola]